MQETPDAPQTNTHPSAQVASPQSDPPHTRIAGLAGAFLQIQPLWVTVAVTFVCVSNILGLDAAFLWIGLALACLPFPVRLARSGITSLRTPFDVPMALLLAGSVVGFCTSDDRGISLGALQCILAITFFYYSWVNFAPAGRIIKGVIISLAVVFLIGCIVYAVAVSIVDGRPNLDLLGSGTHHGFAMYLVIEAAILLGIAAFDRDKRTRLLSLVLFLVLFAIVVVWTKDSLNSLFGGVSLSGRWPIWEKTADLLGDSPIAGLGLGSWALTYWGTAVLDSPVVNGITHAHNAYLELYSNTGMVGALALLVALAIGLRLSLDIIRSPRNHPWYGFGVGVTLACVATLVVGIVESAPMGVPLVGEYSYRYVVSPAVWVICGLLAMSHNRITKSPAPQDGQQERI